jgi:predicted O-methyltransferase YrrM
VALFQKGDGGNKGGGRRQGARHRISTALLEAFAADFEANGAETIKITRIERPTEYLKIAASLLPREFEITHNQIQEISDDELDQLINRVRAELDRGLIDITPGGKEPALNGKPPALLSAVSCSEEIS